jgi:anthranilate/para-aminobenzoate synthase component II
MKYKIKLLVIDNESIHTNEIIKYLNKYNVNFDLINYNNIIKEKIKEYDGIILTGSSNHPFYDNGYEQEIYIIKTSKIPILGICLGFELICFSFGEKLTKLELKEEGLIHIKKIKEDVILDGFNDNSLVYNHHKYALLKVKKLKALAKSKLCIEVVKHKTKIIYGAQFHPEHLSSKLEGYKILDNFLKLVQNLNKYTFD